MFWCYILASILGAIVILYGLLEVHYFLRMILCGILARFLKKRSHILDTTTVTGICLTTDLDTLLYHMNNARYLRELDFARVDFYERTQLYKTIVSKGGSVVQGASTIRYRRFIRPFTMFQITSRIIYWDNQSIFMEHRFISLKDSFIHCIAICRQRILNCSADDVMTTLLSKSDSLVYNINHKNNMKSTTTILSTTTAAATAGAGASAVTTTTTATKTAAAMGTSLTTITTNATTNPTRVTINNLENNSSSGIDAIENGDVAIKLKPEMPLDIAKWMEYNEISSKNLRNGC